ncbi:hypothetical protein [Zunongwangia profunda]|uniref:hypothetical protein n=1 Tax=Zunongwangia profunda TaxID=398743 RepID=UPI001D188400|nr:hypothetical protein [Zunongwangia profunda]MCC4231041.1 hypothetical protein [Zunongwangia profunda]
MPVDWMAPPSNNGVPPSHQPAYGSRTCLRQAGTAVHRPSFQSLFTPIETIPYFKQ